MFRYISVYVLVAIVVCKYSSLELMIKKKGIKLITLEKLDFFVR